MEEKTVSLFYYYTVYFVTYKSDCCCISLQLLASLHMSSKQYISLMV